MPIPRMQLQLGQKIEYGLTSNGQRCSNEGIVLAAPEDHPTLVVMRTAILTPHFMGMCEWKDCTPRINVIHRNVVTKVLDFEYDLGPETQCPVRS